MVRPTRNVFIIQHTDSEYLGLMEDHFEGRGIRFTYLRPHTSNGKLPSTAQHFDAIVFLGGGPWGAAGTNDLPTLKAEVAMAHECFVLGIPQIGVGLGALIVALGAGGTVEDAPLRFKVFDAIRQKEDALFGFMPETFPAAVYMRDKLVLPAYADVLAASVDGEPLAFQFGEKALGFLGHPGTKRAMIEDLVMEFDAAPEDIGSELDKLTQVTPLIEDALVQLMTGIIKVTNLMTPKIL